jgi:hypothetical protein
MAKDDHMDGARIWFACVLAAVVYGIAQDNVTARLCVEYFTVFHPHVINSESPTLLALYWGVAATWWMGAILGVPIALAARLGRLPKLGWREMLWLLGVLLVLMAASALVAGRIGYLSVPPGADSSNLFYADLYAHRTAYLAGAVGAVGVCIWTLLVRVKRAAKRAIP